MQTRIHEKFAGNAEVAIADAIVRSCVHCGFCNATCPTYQDLGDERDGPRGRIYLIKQFLQDGESSETARRHLDRCLTCRSCETTCPSGVDYGRLADIGRKLVEPRARRPLRERVLRWLLLNITPYPRRVAPFFAFARLCRALFPSGLRRQVPARQDVGAVPVSRHEREIILLRGCVQPAATPQTNAAAARVLDRVGVSAVEAGDCCGALSYHLADHGRARHFIRRNLDAWRSIIERGAEAVVSMSSGCTAMLQEYGDIMRDDPDYAGLAMEVAGRARDLSEVLLDEDLSTLDIDASRRTALHCPCTLMHAIGAHESVRRVLENAGVELAATTDDHMCCGSAGTYSILQPGMSRRLLQRKIAALSGADPERIVTANIGCQLHIGSRAAVPVQHWIELLDAAPGDA